MSGRFSHLILPAIAALALAWPSSADACSCVQVGPQQAFDEHDAVFEGRVIDVRREEMQLVVTLEAVQQWKGIDRERVEVRTAALDSLCGIAFVPETSWLIYADDEGGMLRTGLCSRTRRIEDAADDLAVLGAAVVPVEIDPEERVEAASPAPSRAGCGSCAIGRPVDRSPIAFALGTLLLVAWRRRGSSNARRPPVRRGKGTRRPPRALSS